MIAAVQCIAASIGKWGCYFLCILRLAEKALGKFLDPFRFYILAVQGRYMRWNCYLDDPGGFFSTLAGGHWRVLKAGDGKDSAGNDYDLPLAYVPAEGELEIDRFEVAGESEGHFVVGDGATVDWDPYGESRTVREGRLVSKRIFRRTT
ncbi:MAG: DUF261 family protein [Chloroflexi bacterium]|nr:DUF261 family protein [Chloroflexota bacterium]